MSTRPVPAGSPVVVPFDPHVCRGAPHQPGAVVRVVAEQPGYPCRQCLRDAAVTDGAELIAVATAMFEHAAVDHIHVHNAAPGCWAARLERAPAPDAA